MNTDKEWFEDEERIKKALTNAALKANSEQRATMGIESLRLEYKCAACDEGISNLSHTMCCKALTELEEWAEKNVQVSEISGFEYVGYDSLLAKIAEMREVDT